MRKCRARTRLTYYQHDGGVGRGVDRRDLASRDALTISRASTIATGYSLRYRDGDAGCSAERECLFGGGLEAGLIIFESAGGLRNGVTFSDPNGKFGGAVSRRAPGQWLPALQC